MFPVKAGVMILEAIQKVKLYDLLFLIDKDLAERQRAKACPFCNSPLHYSNYSRKPRGGPEKLPEEYLLRFSLCCSAEGCRRRVLPGSLRFWDQKVYFGVVMLVVTALRQRRTDGYSASKLMKIFGVCRHTLKRWTGYFEEIFPFSSRWQKVKGRIGIDASNTDLVAAVVSDFIKHSVSVERGLVLSLAFLSGGLMVI